MGRMGKRKGKGGGKAKNHVSGERAAYRSFDELRRDNESFRKYYQAQKLVDADEFPAFMEAMRTVLPTNFRITGSRQQAVDIREQIMTEFVPYLRSISIEGVDVEPPHPLAWYPHNFGWQFTIPRIALKKSAALGKFHSFLVTETEVGNISRQEAVSMVPPLLLDVQPQHLVLDMCAAPGSKTAQLVEALHAGVAPGETPRGLVVANDADYKRACMLVHQVNRLNSPNIVVTNHSGERFPNIYDGAGAGAGTGGGRGAAVQFDRILCDVPCSGDGTTRKNVRVWEKWRADDAHSLNPIQTKILQRAAYLLKTGGRMVYSTCSLNPIENEAVVAHVLSHFEGALRLVDVSAELPELRRRPGLATWKVMTRDGELHETPASIATNAMPRSHRRYVDAFFPLDRARMDALHIERCMRIYSHLQNTGGFFVAVLEKVAPISVNEKKKAAERAERLQREYDELDLERKREQGAAAEAEAEAVSAAEAVAVAVAAAEDAESGAPKRQIETEAETEEETGATAASEAKRPKVDSADNNNSNDDDERMAPYLPDEPREDPALPENPFVFLDADAGELKNILAFYGIGPSMSRRGFLSRMENSTYRSVYHVSDSVRRLMELAGQRLRVVNTGIRVFNRNCVKDAGCAYRLVCEGVPQLLPHLAPHFVVDVPFADLRVVLEQINPLLESLSAPTRERIAAVPMSSSIIVRYDPAAHAADAEQPFTRLTAVLALPCWRGHASISVHMDKNQLGSLIHRVLGHTIDRSSEGRLKLANNTRSAPQDDGTETQDQELDQEPDREQMQGQDQDQSMGQE
ncbi:tRNA (cytosine-5-)-methyltransferase ncl1 [Coemansia erecta]|uniref:tRNA (Cytosine-5-)-methyltransferase ncl1 n=1 Tax=Coemansia erecta TaxID=147472 RepID=A0A9W8CRM0_9FUNG|nr:tRNA (cytosine-5-)-methyltransferase ncl1 [Coemansia erecta]